MTTPENKESLVMSVPEAGKLIGKGRNMSYKLAHAGVIPTIRLGGRLVVPKERFMRWLNGEGNGNGED